jgi:hypothetical protein
VIAQTVTFIDASAFSNLGDVSISFERGNESFVVDQNFILSPDRTTLIAHFGSDEFAVIPQYVEVLGSSWFCSNTSLAAVLFQGRCRVTRIESMAFRFCPLSSTTVPRSVTFIDGSPLWTYCVCRFSRKWQSIVGHQQTFPGQL